MTRPEEMRQFNNISLRFDANTRKLRCRCRDSKCLSFLISHLGRNVPNIPVILLFWCILSEKENKLFTYQILSKVSYQKIRENIVFFLLYPFLVFLQLIQCFYLHKHIFGRIYIILFLFIVGCV